MARIAFDLDETLGVPIIRSAEMIGWQVRPGSKVGGDTNALCHRIGGGRVDNLRLKPAEEHLQPPVQHEKRDANAD